MTPITIPQKAVQSGDLVVIPKREYEEFLLLKKVLPLAVPTRAEKRALVKAEKEIKAKKYIAWSRLKDELAHISH